MKKKTKLILPVLIICFTLSGCFPVGEMERADNAAPGQDISQETPTEGQSSPPLPQEKEPVHTIIERKISLDLTKPAPVLQGDAILQSAKTLADFYSRQSWFPVWFKKNKPLPAVNEFLEIIAKADEEGLSPHDYHYDTITNLICPPEGAASAPLTNEIIADLDILLTDAYKSYISHLRWGKSGRGKDLAKAILPRNEELQFSFPENIPGKSQLKEIIASFIPDYPEYAQLKQILMRYRQIETEGGWPVIKGKSLTKGNNGPRVAALKKRLHFTGELEQIIPEQEDIFDEDLEKAVRLFQKTQRLKENGVADTATLKLMNVPVTERIQQIRMDMERWRWMPRDLDRYILVDIPDFSMKVIENGETAMQMKTIVGTVKNPTPIFSGRLSFIEINPNWNVPISIIRNEIIPETKKDPSYIARHRIKIYENWRSNAQEISPDSLDWETINPQKFPYRLVQDPGSHNSLGRIKFFFPNVHDVYMHDTPSRYLFKRKERALSHGCIRLEHPINLAEHLLKNDDKWDRKRIQKQISTNKGARIALSDPIPVYITYFLVRIDGDSGYPFFRKDFYSYNRPLEKEMKRK
jgi:murein L,D-transpeptidase YcbB/YkuD